MTEIKSAAGCVTAETKRKVFLSVMTACITVTIVAIIIQRSRALYSMFFMQFQDSYMDFFNCVRENTFNTTYSGVHSIYPPLLNLFYHFLSKIAPNMHAKEMAATTQGLVLYFTVQSLCSAVFLTGIWVNTASIKKMLYRVLTVFCAILSLPFLYAFERGNSITIAIGLILWFLRFNKSENKMLRETGLILLALSANIKFWPALFGFLLIRQKQWKEAIRCVLYGIILFMIPIAFFFGLEAIRLLMDNLMAANNNLSTMGGLGYKINWWNTLQIIKRMTGISLPDITVSILAVLMILCTAISKSRSTFLSGIALVCTGFPAFSGNYNALYLFIPICAFLDDEEGNRFQILFLILSALAVSPLGINISYFENLGIAGEWYHLNLSTVVSGISVLLLSLIYVVYTLSGNNTLYGRIAGKQKTA